MFELRFNRPKTGKVCIFVEVTKRDYVWGDECIVVYQTILSSILDKLIGQLYVSAVLAVGIQPVTRRMGKSVKFRAGRFAVEKRKIYFPLGNEMAFSLSTNSLLSHHITELRRLLSETAICIVMEYNSITTRTSSEWKDRTYLILQTEEA